MILLSFYNLHIFSLRHQRNSTVCLYLHVFILRYQCDLIVRLYLYIAFSLGHQHDLTAILLIGMFYSDFDEINT